MWSSYPLPPLPAAFRQVTERLDPVLVPLGFIAGQCGASDREGQVIFCRGFDTSPDDGCIDLVVEMGATPEWKVVGVRYWGFTSDRWHLPFVADAALDDQLADLARTLPVTLAGPEDDH